MQEREEEWGLGSAIFETALGWMGVVASDQGLAGVVLPKSSREDVAAEMAAGWSRARPLGESEARRWTEPLSDYALGKRREFQLPLDLSRQTAFRRLVWEETQRIPYGQTRSYGWIAQQVGRPHAARAVGQALGANPVPIIIPCHRVVGSNGDLCGFGGGLDVKVRLLELERNTA